MDTTRRLPDGELAVMQALWDLEPPVTSGELQQQLKESHPMALTTLLTVLTRLADKEFVKIEKEGRSSRYSSRGKATWRARAGGFWTRCAGAACLLSRRLCVTAA